MIRFLICCLIGHKWVNEPVDEHAAVIAQEQVCARCGTRADWWK
jgi:hypothetical protein